MGIFKASEPESYTQLLRRSLTLYRATFARVFLFAMFLAIISSIPRLLSVTIGQDIFYKVDLFSPYRLWLVLVDLGCLIFFVAIIWRMRCTIHGQHEPLIKDLKMGIQKLLYVFVASVIQSASLFATILMIYGFILILSNYWNVLFANILGTSLVAAIFIGQFFLILYVFTLFLFYLPIIAIEHKGILASLEQSVELAWNHWWRIMTVQLTPWLCYLGFYLFTDYLFPNSQQTWWLAILNLIAFALYIPWFAATLIIQLKDAELRQKLGK